LSPGPRNVWAVGLTQQPGSSQTVGLTVHWNGTAWTPVPAGKPGSDLNLHAVLAVPVGAVWSVGSGTSPQPPFAAPVSFRYARGAWRQAAVPFAFGSPAGLAAGPGGRLWAAGAHLNRHGIDVPLIIIRTLAGANRPRGQ
jgi:hypothetical protein